MRIGVVALLMMGCGGAQEPAPTSNVAAQPSLRCKTAVEQASTAVKLRERDITMAVGECERHEWPQAARECVGAAKTSEALVTCGTTYNLDARIFAKTAPTEVLMKKMESFRDEMCACKDTPCAQRVSDEMAKWAQAQAKETDSPPAMTDDDTRRATEIGETMGKCMQAAMGAGSPTP